MQTIKLEYAIAEEDELTINEFRRQFAACVRSAYSRIREGMSDKETYHYLKSLNNLNLMNSCSLKSVLYKAHSIVDYERGFYSAQENRLKTLQRKLKSMQNGDSSASQEKISKLKKKCHELSSRKNTYVFGGRGIFKSLQSGEISKEEFLEKRLGCYECYGEKENYGNPHFAIASFKTAILFKPCKELKIYLTLKNLSDRQKYFIDKLYEHQLMCDIPITYKLNGKNIFITFDEKILYGKTRKDKISNRVIAIDQNPNYIGWSVVDWRDNSKYTIIASGVFSLKQINDKCFACHGERLSSINNKRNFEHFQIAKKLIGIGIHYKCDVFGIEKLNFYADRDTNCGYRINRLVNRMWNRTNFTDALKRQCAISDFTLVEADSRYSSKYGNVLYRKHGLPDMVNASIEIGRRAVEFKRQYIEHSEDISHTIIHPDLTHFGDVLAKSMEEFGITEEYKDLYELFGALAKRKKNSELLYRVPLKSTRPRWFKSSSKRSLVFQCEYTDRNIDELTSKGSSFT